MFTLISPRINELILVLICTFFNLLRNFQIYLNNKINILINNFLNKKKNHLILKFDLFLVIGFEPLI